MIADLRPCCPEFVDKPHFTALDVTDLQAASVSVPRDQLVDKPLLEAFPTNLTDPENRGPKQLHNSLVRALESKEVDQMSTARYDLFDPTSQRFEERYWVADNTPVFCPDDPTKVAYILHCTRDVTQFVKSQAAMERSAQLESEKQHMKIQIMERASELDRTNDRLRETNDRLNRALATKSDFIANVSHEIRTPLNAVNGFAQVLENEPELSENHRHQISLIHKAGQHLLCLVNDLLDMARIDAGKLELVKAPVRPADIVQEVVNMLSVSAQQKGLTLTAHCDSSLPDAVLGDTVRIRQMLLNITGNAVKFTSQGSVSITATAIPYDSDIAETLISFKIRDTGPGISDEDIETLFERFNQAKNRVALGGTGLGLAITRQLALLMSGDVYVTSQVGKGSEFELRIRLPVTSSRLLPAVLAGDHFTRVRPAQRSLPVLVVDDMAANREVAVSILHQFGFQNVIEAQNGAECLAKLRSMSSPPCCVLMDLFMPVMDGFQALGEIRQKPLYDTIPVVAVSASVVDFQNDRGALDKFTAVLPKPYSMRELKHCLTRFSGIEFVRKSLSLDQGGEDHRIPLVARSELEPTASSKALQRRVLIVDDNATNRCVLAALLTKLGHSFQACSSGLEAIGAVRNSESCPFDLILMDKYMPGMNGIEATREIGHVLATLGRPRHPRFVSITASELSIAEKQEFERVGISTFLPKPFNLAELAATVEDDSEYQLLPKENGYHKDNGEI